MSHQRRRAVVLLSGGLDSSFNFYRSLVDYDVVLALTIDYGQRAALREIEAANHLSKSKGVRHQSLSLKWFSQFTNTSLVSTQQDVPTRERVNIESSSTSRESAKAVWVPNRNGILLNVAAGFAEGLGACAVIVGFNKEEAETFPDNSVDFIAATNDSLRYSTNGAVKVECYSQDLVKSEIVVEGQRLGLPFVRLWPCYLGGEQWCGECESCLRFRRALDVAKVSLGDDQ